MLGHALWLAPVDDAHAYVAAASAGHGRYVAGGLIDVAGAFLMIPAALGVLRLVQGRGVRLGTIGAALAGIGAAGMGAGIAVIAVIAVTVGMLTPGRPALAEQVYDTGNHSTLGSALFLLAPVFAVGVLLLAAALWRSGQVARPSAGLLAAGVVLASAAPAGGAKGAVMHLPFAAAVALLGLALLRPSGRRGQLQAASAASTSAP